MPGGAKTLFMPVRAFGAPQTTWIGVALARIDHADAQAIGIRMLLGRDHIGDRVRREGLGLVLDALDLEADAGQRLDDLVERGRGVEMILQPGECEFHRFSPVTTSGR